MESLRVLNSKKHIECMKYQKIQCKIRCSGRVHFEEGIRLLTHDSAIPHFLQDELENFLFACKV